MRTRKILLYFSDLQIPVSLKQEISEAVNEPLLSENDLKAPNFCKLQSGIYVIQNLTIFEAVKKYNTLKLLVIVPETSLNSFLAANFTANKIDILSIKNERQLPGLLREYLKNFKKHEDHITFMKICEAYELKGACLSRSVGVVIIKNKKIISGSENNTSGLLSCLKGECNFCNKKSKNISECICVHAETNALLGVRVPINEDTTIYSTTFPCYACTLQIISAGIKKIVFRDFYKEDTQKQSLELFRVNSVVCLKLDKRVGFPGYDLVDVLKGGSL